MLIAQTSALGKAASGGSVNYTELKSGYAKVADESQQLSDAAPPAISAPAKTLATDVKALSDAVQKTSSLQQATALFKSNKRLQSLSLDVAGAVAKIITWSKTNCS